MIRSKIPRWKKPMVHLVSMVMGIIFSVIKTNHEGLSSWSIYHMTACMRFFSDNFCLPTTPLSKAFMKLKSMKSEIIISIISVLYMQGKDIFSCRVSLYIGWQDKGWKCHTERPNTCFLFLLSTHAHSWPVGPKTNVLSLTFLPVSFLVKKFKYKVC